MNLCENWVQGSFVLTTDKSKLQIKRVHRFLSQEAQWSIGIPIAVVEKAVEHSLCFGLFDKSKSDDLQIGFARVVGDKATFAWLCDVYIEKEYRGQGLAKWLMDCLMNHSDLQGLRRICLATKDAHKLYEKYGFEITNSPGNWLEIKNNDIYKKTENTTF